MELSSCFGISGLLWAPKGCYWFCDQFSVCYGAASEPVIGARLFYLLLWLYWLLWLLRPVMGTKRLLWPVVLWTHDSECLHARDSASR